MFRSIFIRVVKSLVVYWGSLCIILGVCFLVLVRVIKNFIVKCWVFFFNFFVFVICSMLLIIFVNWWCKKCGLVLVILINIFSVFCVVVFLWLFRVSDSVCNIFGRRFWKCFFFWVVFSVWIKFVVVWRVVMCILFDVCVDKFCWKMLWRVGK